MKQKEDNLKVGFKGGAIAFVLQASSAVLGFLNTIILARILGAGGLGEVILAMSVMSICAMIAGFGMNAAMMRFVPFYIEKKEEAKVKGIIYFFLKFCFGLSVAFSALMVLFSNFISSNIFHSQGLLKLLPITALILPFYVLNGVISGTLRGYKDTFKSLFPHMFVSPFLKVIVFLLLSLRSISSMYAIVALLIAEIISLVFYLIFLFKKMDKAKPLYEWSEYKEIFDVGLITVFNIFSSFLYTQADLWIIGMFTSTETVGVYGVVTRLVTLIAFSLGAFSTIIPPIISAIYTSGDRDEMQKIVSESTRWSLSVSIPIILLLVLEGKFILRYAYGEKFIDGYIPLVILSIGQLINVGAGLVGWLLQITGGHRVYLGINIFCGLFSIVLNIILVPRFGITGAAISAAFSLAMVNIISIFVVRNRLSILTLANGLKFDVGFSIIIAILYILVNYNGFYMGLHILSVVALIAYISKTIINRDLPLQYLLQRYRS